MRALRLLQAEYARRHGRLPPGIDVAIDKILPMGGGLGGGSSDAATALMAANHLWQAGLTRDELMALGLPLGADIPFFLFGETAFAEGVGETLQAGRRPRLLVRRARARRRRADACNFFCGRFDKGRKAGQNSGLFQPHQFRQHGGVW